jgi:enoyl-[acyl-carrier protein] reductase II
MVLGAQGVQIGSRYVASEEASSHIKFKEAVINSAEGDTKLMLKQLSPVRLLKNHFYQQVQSAEDMGASKEELIQLLGRARAKKGMFEGDLEEGELEIGQVSALLDDILPAAEITQNIWREFQEALEKPITYNR